MPFLPDAFRTRLAQLSVLGLAALLGSCTSAPADPPTPPVVSGLGNDASVGSCSFPDEGCPCDPGTASITCVVDPPVVRNGQTLCQHGTRVCRDSIWSACEDITLFAPSGNKILGAPGAVSTCRPDEYRQTSTPDDTDLTPTNSSNLDYTTTAPSGLVLETLPPGTDPLGVDTDMDGVPNIVDDCPMDNQHWLLPCTGPMSAQGFFHILSPGETATDPMAVDLQVKTVDTYLLIDTTASMGGEIANLRSGLSGLMSSIQTSIPGANFGLGMYRETSVSVDSQSNDFPFMHLLDPTSSLAVAQNITNQVLDTEGNSYWPEAGAQALYAIASGRGIGPWVGARATCPNGGFGWPCFRPGTVPVVIVVADAPWWNGPSFATTDPLRRRTELSHVPYPGTNGTTTIASRTIPRATVVSSTGQIMISNDTAATAFLVGDMTDRSLTVHGANNGASTRLVNDFTEACGGRTPSGPDVFYTFTIDTPRHFVFEAFADFDPTLYLRRVNAGVASTMGCNLDSANVADGNGNLVWRTGAKIDTRTIPGVGATTTNVTLNGCTASASDVPFPMTGCNVATSTTNASLTGCTVPSQTFNSTMTGCAVDNTPTVATFTGCSVPSSTTSTVSGCSYENVTTAATLTGCVIPSTTTTSNFTGCQIAPTTTTTLNSCAFPTTTTSVTLARCEPTNSDYTNITNGSCTRQWTQTTNLTGCTIPNVTTTGNYTGCSLRATVVLTGCSTTNGDTYVGNCDAWGIEVGTPVSGTGIPAGATVASIGSSGGGNPRIILSVNATSSGNNRTITNDVTNQLTNCSGGTTPQVGMTISGNNAVVGTGRTISAYSGTNPYTFFLSTPPAGSNGNCGGSGSGGCGGRTTTGTITGPNLNQFTNCTVSSGSAPANNMRLVGTGLTANASISSVTGSGPYTINMSGPASSSAATLTGLRTQSNTVWENCDLNSGAPPAVGMVLDINNGPAGDTTITAVSGSDPYTITTSQALTNGSADIRGADSYTEFHGTGGGEWCRSIGATHPSVGMTVSGTGLQANTTISSVSWDNNRACSGSNGTSDNYCQANCTFNANGTCSGCTYRSDCNGASSRWFYWTDIDLDTSTSDSATLTSASSTTYDLTQVTGCTIPGGSTVPLVGWTLGGTGLSATPTITSISASSPYTIGLSAGAASSSASTITSATSAASSLGQFVNCTLAGGNPVPTAGMVVTGTNLGGATTITGTPTLNAGKYTISVSPNVANASATMSSAATTTYTTNRVTNCTRSSGTLQNGQTVTGTGLPASPVVANLTGSGAGPYAFDFGTVGSSTTSPTYSVSGATVTTPDLTHVINCAVSGLAPAAGDVLGASGFAVGATVASATGSGPYRINFSAGAAPSTSATLTTLTRTTAPQLDRLTGCVLSGGSATPVAGMELAGTSLISTMAPLPTIVGTPTLSAGTYTVMMSRNASAAGAIMTVTGTNNSYNLGHLINCTVSGDPLTSLMTVTGSGLAAGTTTITGVTPTGGGKYAIDISPPAALPTATATAATRTVNYLRRLDNCSLASGSLSSGMTLTGSLLAAGTTVSTFTGTGPYTINIDRDASAVGPTTASGTITVPLPQLTGCQGNFLLLDTIGIQGPGIPAGTTIASFGGLGTGANPWVIDLSQTPTTAGTNLTVNAMMPGLSNQLTGCMIVAPTGPLIDASGVPPGMAMSGANIAPGSTLTLATGTGAGPYTLTLSDTLTAMGPTDAAGTITIGASGGAAPLAPGTYQLVVDSGTQNAASASSPGRGTFQLRMTNLTNPPGAADATEGMEVPWATTAAALNAAGIKTIGVASCPAGCLDLAARQDAYATCVQGATPTNTTGADNTNLTNTYCGAGYNRCIAVFGAAQMANCTTVFNDCRAAEISAGQQNLNVRTNACNAAQSSCNRVRPGNAANCTSVYNYCRGSSGTPASPATAAVCTTQASSISTCLSAAAGGSSDAATYCDETLYDLGQMGVATGSVRPDGTPFVYQIAEDGSGLSATIADGVRDLARYILFDVTGGCEPAGSVACNQLFTNAVVPRAGATSPVGQVPGCTSCSGPTCLRCTPGAQLPYAINFGNAVGTGVAPTTVNQVFDFFIVLRDATGAEMSRAPVRIVVPPTTPMTVAPSGTFTQLYTGTLDSVNNTGCPYPARRADWGTFTYSASLPAGTAITFAFRAGDTAAQAAMATPVTFNAVTAVGATFDVGALLEAAGQANYHPYLQLTATLTSDPTQTLTPVLQTYQMDYACIDAE